jgi:2-dehydro-3-deoxyphosphogluconate aldolase / (4S)-4-hydroxy-2-oxoglutarate aldolase
MTKAETCARLLDIGIIPVVRALSPAQAFAAAEAVCKGGIPVVEITMTVPGAVDVIAQLVKSMGNEVLIGAGTVVDGEGARRCLDAGAQFLVSPGFSDDIVREAVAAGVPVAAGALTPTEIMAATRAGADFIKIFPCAQVGGPAYIKALRGPFPRTPFIPTGGVNLNTAADFLRAGAAALGVGGELVERSALESGRTEVIVDNARRLVAVVQQTRAAMREEKMATSTR